tara:strand:- start:1362 stop:2366 length:1005 start_codon:yes stop_codon:yes gene_type:complete
MQTQFFKKQITKLTIHHFDKCHVYKKILLNLNYNLKNLEIEKQPFLPVSIFKNLELLSTKKNKIVKILQSSGTTSNIPSKIFLDKENAKNQKITLSKLVEEIIGSKRLPMLIIDKKPDLKDKKNIGARIAGIYGFSIFGTNHTYLLNNNNQIDYRSLNIFLDKFSDKSFLIFGFTSLVYKYLFETVNLKKINKNFANSILIHGGGWKKMLNKKVDNSIFRKKLLQSLKIKNIYNYYGLVEQTGSIFFECPKCNCFTTTKYSDILIRDKNYKILNNSRGIIQLISLLPTSYPGHSILTEDEGKLIHNNCKCKKNGKRFIVYGRIEKSEVRGCSDT